MTDRVQCGECSHLYDSDEHPFCPRCGALDKAKDPDRAVGLAAVQDPRRRPVQMAGVMMITLGGLALVLFAATAILAPSLVPQTIEAVADYEGGTIALEVVDGDVPVAGATVDVHALNGTLLANGTTDAEGRFVVEEAQAAAVNVTVSTDAGTWTRQVFSLPEENGGSPTSVVIDVSVDPQEPDGWTGVSEIVNVSRILAAFFALASLVTLLGGVAAVRLRKRQWALAGAGLGLVPTLMLTVVAWSFLLFPVLFGLAIMVFVRNRDVFQD